MNKDLRKITIENSIAKDTNSILLQVVWTGLLIALIVDQLFITKILESILQ